MGDRAETLISPELQLEAIKKLADREGYEILQTFEDLDVSGGDSRRPLWQRALKLVEQGKARGVVVYNLSRFSRSQIDALTAIDRLKAVGGFLHSAQEGQFDDSPTGTLLRDTLFRFAQFERDRAKESFKLSIKKAVADGRAVMSTIPLGYVRDPETRRLEIDPLTAPVVKEAFERRAAGESHDAVARWLTGQGYAKNGSGVRYMLRNETYLGVMRSGDEVNPNAHDPVVSRRLFDKASKKGARAVGPESLTHLVLLRGIARCAACGYLMGVNSHRYRGKVIPAYYCRNIHCARRAWGRADLVDEYVEAKVLDYLDLLEVEATQVTSVDDEQLQAELEAARARLADAQYDLSVFSKDVKARRLMGDTVWYEALNEYHTMVNLAQTDVNTLEAGLAPATKQPVVELWQSWSIGDRHEYLERMLESVTIERGKDPMEDRVRLAVVKGSGTWLRPFGPDKFHWAVGN